MLDIHVLALGDYQTNCYVVHPQGEKHCVVIDPGYTPEYVLEKLEAWDLQVEAVLLTHGHFDHVGGVRQIAADTDAKVFLNTKDLALPPRLTDGPLYYTDDVKDGAVLHLAGMDITVLETPGHTPGSVCYLIEDQMFSGDTLFYRTCGRTDLPGGSPQQMLASLKRLSALPGNYKVYPGHDCSTTLDGERAGNPYL